MQPENIKAATKGMSYDNAVSYIQSLPLELSLIRDMKIERLWRVENNPIIDYITVSYNSLVTGKAHVGIITKY